MDIVKWHRITEILPKDLSPCLVWNGHDMFVAVAEIYSDVKRQEMLNVLKEINALESLGHHWRTCPGSFHHEFERFYFDDPKVFWAELPSPPEEK